MSKKENKKQFKTTVSSAINKTKNIAKQTNEFALNTTEEVVLGTINVAGQWQNVTDKALKAGLRLMENQQDLVFSLLEMFKSQLVQGKKRITKIFA